MLQRLGPNNTTLLLVHRCHHRRTLATKNTLGVGIILFEVALFPVVTFTSHLLKPKPNWVVSLIMRRGGHVTYNHPDHSTLLFLINIFLFRTRTERNGTHCCRWNPLWRAAPKFRRRKTAPRRMKSSGTWLVTSSAAWTASRSAASPTSSVASPDFRGAPAAALHLCCRC